MKKKIKILGSSGTLEYIPNVKGVLGAEDYEYLYGAYVPKSNTVYIDSEHCDNSYDLRDTLIHELIEAANSVLELELEHPQITAVSRFLTAVITENAIIKESLYKGKIE